MKIILVSGRFDSLHSGHIEYFKSEKNLGDKLVVGVDSGLNDLENPKIFDRQQWLNNLGYCQ